MLTDAKIKAAKPRGSAYKLGDTGQLFHHVTPAGGKHWRMNYTYGRSPKDPKKPGQKTLSFGSYPSVTLVEARRKRDDAKDLLREGRDPAIERRVAHKARAEEGENTFERVARRWHGSAPTPPTSPSPSWRSTSATTSSWSRRTSTTCTSRLVRSGCTTCTAGCGPRGAGPVTTG